jgi:hypothetical protein
MAHPRNLCREIIIPDDQLQFVSAVPAVAYKRLYAKPRPGLLRDRAKITKVLIEKIDLIAEVGGSEACEKIAPNIFGSEDEFGFTNRRNLRKNSDSRDPCECCLTRILSDLAFSVSNDPVNAALAFLTTDK